MRPPATPSGLAGLRFPPDAHLVASEHGPVSARERHGRPAVMSRRSVMPIASSRHHPPSLMATVLRLEASREGPRNLLGPRPLQPRVRQWHWTPTATNCVHPCAPVLCTARPDRLPTHAATVRLLARTCFTYHRLHSSTHAEDAY